MTDWKKSRFVGVRYRDNPKRKHQGKSDRYFLIRFGKDGLTVSEGVGWASGGITMQLCNNLRGEILSNIRLGSGFQSIKEKRELEEARKLAKQQEKDETKRKNTPFDVIARRFIEWAKENKASWRDDESRYRIHIKPVIGHIPIQGISTIQLEGLKREIKNKDLSPTTVKHCLVLVRTIFYRAVGWGLFHGENPVTKTAKTDKKFLKIPDNRRKRFLSDEEADLLMEDLSKRSDQLHDICLLSLWTGMRMGEIFSLVWADIDLAHDIITVLDPKNDIARQVFMNAVVKAMFQGRATTNHKKGDLVFLNRKGKKIREISDSFDRAIKKLKFNQGIKDPRQKVTAHTLRHTYASWQSMRGVPITTLKDLLGHQDIQMTMRYSHLLPDVERKAVLDLELHKKEKNGEVKKLSRKA